MLHQLRTYGIFDKNKAEWADIKVETGAEHGKMVDWIRDHTLEPTSYSPEFS